MSLCDYGCGQFAVHKFDNGKWCCSRHAMSCPEKRKERSIYSAGKNNPMYGKKHKADSIEKMKKPHYGVRGDNHPNRRPEMKDILRERFDSDYVRSFIDPVKQIINSTKANKDPQKRKKQSKLMKNGLSKYVSSFITHTKPVWNKGKKNCFSEETLEKISKSCRLSVIKRIEERKLNGNQLCPNYNPAACTIIDEYGKQNNYNFQHGENEGEFYIKSLGYWVDGYDRERNTIIEVDEPHHFDEKGNLHKKDIRRQEEIMKELGCNFIRLRIDKDNNIISVK